ncbi:hypothetical protein [Chryseobacterium viscerum]|uniref:Uncharacterized protein n=1 Tax=Chryseobacterium viscerum TaxID=1037377 RepID=A0A316WLB0_9FLAO|nr:hypothetical protein [Chryseobacterium viscerum]PWN61243.1 hypothetical protein C1634_014400 [Chryseobacterium viscerum]
MNKIFLPFLLFSLVINAQNFKCKSAHIGKFQVDNGEYGITVIERNSTSQIETNEKMGYKARYDISWINDCQYQLKNRKVIKGKSHEGSTPDDVLMATILKVVNEKVFLRLSSNFSDEVMECEMIKIK